MIIYTNAPKDYDYWYVTELDPDIGNFNSGIDKDRPVRKLDIKAEEWQVQFQRDRYSSGLYPSLTEEQFQDWIDYGFVDVEEDESDYLRGQEPGAWNEDKGGAE